MTETNTNSDETNKIKPILKRKSLNESEIKALPSILKKNDSFEMLKTSSIPILKRHSLGSELDNTGALAVARTTSILKSTKSHRSLDEQQCSSFEAQALPKPILKKKMSAEEFTEVCLDADLATNNKTKSILKDSERKVSMGKQEVRGILKSPPSNLSTVPVKSALKKTDQHIYD